MKSKTDASVREEILEDRRLALEERLADLRGAAEAGFGWAPKAKTWLVPVLVGAAGLVAGMAVKSVVGKLLVARSSRRLR